MSAGAKAAMSRRLAANANANMVKNSSPSSYGTVANANVRRPPVASMASQVAFSQAQQQPPQPNFNLQQQQQMQQPTRQIGPGQRMPTQQIAPQLSQRQQIQQHQQMGGNSGNGGNGVPPNKISLDVAFALTTIRLGQAEQQIFDMSDQIQALIMAQEMQEIEMRNNGGGNGNETTNSIPEGSKIIDKTTFDEMQKKLDVSDKTIRTLMTQVTGTTKQINDLMRAINELNKHAKFTTGRIDQFEGTLNGLELAINSIQSFEQPTLDGFGPDEGAFANMEMDQFDGGVNINNNEIQQNNSGTNVSVHDSTNFTQQNPMIITTNKPDISLEDSQQQPQSQSTQSFSTPIKSTGSTSRSRRPPPVLQQPIISLDTPVPTSQTVISL